MNFPTSAAGLIPLIASSVILVAGVIDDLRSRKFHNWLFLSCTAFAIVVTVIASGPSALVTAMMGFMAGFAILLPLVLMNIVGAGDMKLMAAFGLLAGWNAVIEVVVFAFVWGAIFGVVRALVSGHGKTLLRNLFLIVVYREKGQSLELQRIPFTVAILFGWLTHLVRSGAL